MHAWRLALSIHGPTASRDESVRNDRKYALSFPIIFFYSETIHLKMIPITKNWYIGNKIIRLKICRYRSTTVPQIENTETKNGHICKMLTTKWVTNSPTWILLHAHTITTYDSQLLNFAANKFLSQQPTYRLGCWRWSRPRVGDCEWRFEAIYVGLCY
jgi:hypothetical protein